MYTIGLSCPPQGKNCINYDLNSHIKIIHTVHYKIVAIYISQIKGHYALLQHACICISRIKATLEGCSIGIL